MAVIEDVSPLGAELQRSYQVYVRGRLKFRVKQIVYVAFSLDETVMGFAFPRQERAALIASEPHKFQMPSASDMRFDWIESNLAALDPTEARELVVDAWRMVVPKKLSRAYVLAYSHEPVPDSTNPIVDAAARERHAGAPSARSCRTSPSSSPPIVATC
ncbi:hypothetical protein ABTW96_08760 [Nocardia beijingensis]|uniref:hypothetical protein n=1 Tax=Nocardia beijingensis TaxID=95162 RepID=UPI003330B384